ncbi:MAG: hypothetical protein A2474_06355 [Elusimicrobia bacterium RIFOXYC2_FULL_34_12]|nr:MAG: hypothetical protein A2474_06355 [Elusimicrobia bacterium RIFOXYC2_FULL_34_12]
MTKKDKIFIIFILLITIFQYNEIIFNKKIFFIRDLTYLFHPWKIAITESLLKGNMPLWNPYSYSGMPLTANFQTAVFYPFSIIFYIFGFIKGLKLFIILHTALGSLFIFLYFRSKKYKTISSFTAGIIFAFGGYLITKTEFLSLFGTVIWLPLILMLFSSTNIFIGSLVFSFIIFAGYPPLILFILILLLIDAFLERKIKKLFLIIFFGTLISSIQLIPSIELIFNSVRKSGLNISDTSIWSANYFDIIALISPIFLKIEKSGLFTGEKYFWLKSYWLGFTAVLSAIFGFLLLITKKNKKALIYSILFLLAIFFALGTKTPIYEISHKYIPGINLIRYPSHIMIIPFFILIYFSATGINNINKSYLISLFIVVELLIYSFNINSTIEHDYYLEKGPIVNFLQKDKDYFRFFQTPKTNWSNKIQVPDYGNIGFYILRDRLSGIVSITSHIYDIGGIGEPIELMDHALYIYKIYSQNCPDEANELLSIANVKYLLADYYFKSNKWDLVYKTHLFVYRNKNFIERAYVVEQNNIKKNANITYYEPEKVKIETTYSGDMILSDSYYPGWQAYVNGKRSTIQKQNYIFRAVKLKNSDNYTITFLYNPVLFKIGLLISLISICIIIIIEKPYNYY